MRITALAVWSSVRLADICVDVINMCAGHGRSFTVRMARVGEDCNPATYIYLSYPNLKFDKMYDIMIG